MPDKHRSTRRNWKGTRRGGRDLGVDAAGVGGEGFGGEGLGGESGGYLRAEGFGRHGESEVQFGGAAAQQGGGFEVEAGVLAGGGGDGRGSGFGGEFGGRAEVLGRRRGDDALVVAGEFVEGVLPAVAL